MTKAKRENTGTRSQGNHQQGAHKTAKPANGENQRIGDGERMDSALTSALIDSGNALTSVLDLEPLLDRILVNLLRALPCDAASILSLNQSTGQARILCTHDLGKKSTPAASQVRRFAIQDLPGFSKLVDTRQPLIIRDSRIEPGWLALPGCEWIHSSLGMPIRTGDQTIGFIHADSAAPGVFSEQDYPVLTAFADLAAVALENARLREIARRRADEFAALYETTHDLELAQPDLSAVLLTIVHRAISMLQASDGGIYLYDPARNDLVVTTATNPLKLIGSRVRMGEGMAGRVAQSRQPMIVDDYRTWPNRLPAYEGTPLTAVIEVPMLYEGDLIGVLTVEEFGETDKRFTEEDARILTIFAGQAAGVVHRWKLSQELDQSVSQKNQTDALQDAVYQIAVATVTTDSLDTLYPKIHEIISSVMPAENFFITLYDEEHNLLQFPYFHDALDEPYLSEIEPGQGLTAYVLKTGKSLLCTQAVHNELERQGAVKLLGTPSAIWLGVPLITEGKTVGAMVVQHYSDPIAYGEREQHMLEFVSSQVALAIIRKRAEEQLRYLGTHDLLTGLYNRVYFESEMKRIEHAQQYPVSIVMADVDHLKATNDSQGHAAGDAMLKRVARVLTSAFRSDDIIARIGGDEFAIILPNTDTVAAERTLQRLQDSLAKYNNSHIKTYLSLSLGVCTAEKQGPLTPILNEADKRMYLNKQSRSAVMSSAN